MDNRSYPGLGRVTRRKWGRRCENKEWIWKPSIWETPVWELEIEMALDHGGRQALNHLKSKSGHTHIAKRTLQGGKWSTVSPTLTATPWTTWSLQRSSEIKVFERSKSLWSSQDSLPIGKLWQSQILYPHKVSIPGYPIALNPMIIKHLSFVSAQLRIWGEKGKAGIGAGLCHHDTPPWGGNKVLRKKKPNHDTGMRNKNRLLSNLSTFLDHSLAKGSQFIQERTFITGHNKIHISYHHF